MTWHMATVHFGVFLIYVEMLSIEGHHWAPVIQNVLSVLYHVLLDEVENEDQQLQWEYLG